MSDDEFLEAFERCTLVKSDWTHAAHVRMAWLYMSRNDFDEALRCIRQGIRRLNGHFGTASEKYHDTMTIAYSALIRERIERDPSVADWPGFTARYPETLDWSEPLPLRHYTRERLFSRAAHEAYIEPDIAPLPMLNVHTLG